MLTREEIINRDVDEFLWYLMPFGSLDIRHMLITAYDVNISPRELADILHEQAESFGINLFDQERTTDLNALFNDYILQMARNDIENVLNIDLLDYDVYFFANYLDDPLQYPSHLAERLEEEINEKELTKDDFDVFAQYVLDEMGISLNECEEE